MSKALAVSWIATLCLAQGAWADHHEAPSGSSASEAAAMEAMQRAGAVTASHGRLANSAGVFKATMRSWTSPDAPPIVSAMEVRREMTLGGRVLEETWTGEVFGMSFVGVGRTGYDNITGRYWSTWTDNTSTGVFISYGEWDEDAQRFVFQGELTDPISGQPMPTRMVSTYPSEDEETMTMYQAQGGQEVKAMAARLVRQR
ncbi:MAG: DUF1579 family protein [Pseudomonadota bacterium]